MLNAQNRLNYTKNIGLDIMKKDRNIDQFPADLQVQEFPA